MPPIIKKHSSDRKFQEENVRYDMVCGLSDKNNNISTETRLRKSGQTPGKRQEIFPLMEIDENDTNRDTEVAFEDDDGEDLSAPPPLNEGVHPVDFYTRILFPLFYGLAMIIYYQSITDQPTA